MKKLYFLCLIVAFAIATKANAALTIDDLVGTYEESVSGSDYWNNESWVDFEQEDVVTISKINETTVAVYNLYGWEYDLIGTVDLTAGTITFEPQNFSQYYLFCYYPWNAEGKFSEDGPVVATIGDDGNTIEIADWALVYPGYSTAYAVATSKLTKIHELWTATGNYDAGEQGKGEATITAYDNGSYDLGLPLGHNLKFKVDENGQFVFIGGSGANYEGYIGIWFWDFFVEGDCISLYDDDNMVLEITEEGGVISCTAEYYPILDAEAVMGTFSFTWGTGTGISATKSACDSNAHVYSLSGMRMGNLSNLQKGVYISNGKKFVVK